MSGINRVRLGGSGVRRLTSLPWRRSVAVCVAGALSVALLNYGPAAAEDWEKKQDEIDRQVNESSDLLEDANESVRQATAQLNDARAQLPAAQARLDDALAREAAARQAEAEATDALEQATAELIAAQQRLAQIDAEFEALRSDVGDFARRAYQMGPFAEIEMVLDAQDPTEFTDRLAAIRSVSQANNQALGEIATNRADQAYLELRQDALRDLAAEKKAIAEQKLREAEAAKNEAMAAKQLVDLLIAQQDAALAVAEAQRSSVQGQYLQLQQEQARIAAAAQRAVELARQAAASSGGSVSWSSGEGFTWPIAGGGLTQGSGPRIHPVYGYRSCHTGVDVRGGYGTPILAAQNGVVASIENGGPYGLHTIIAHGDGVTSFYAHQSRTVVSPGSTVSAGQVIGYVGSTGWVTGPHLHYEIHVNGRPYDPLGWYGGSKYAISC